MVGARKIIPMEEFVAVTVAKIVKDKFFNGPASPKFKNATLNYVLDVLIMFIVSELLMCFS